jgi:CDP-glycerol glycerophosphotransferase (TagB/SpsB family)
MFYTRLLYNILIIPLYCISYFIPKNKKIWVFGAWEGNKFADNSKYLYLYVKNTKPNIRPIWIMRNKDAIKLLIKNGIEVYHTNSLKGFYYSAIAKISINSNSNAGTNFFLLGNCKKIQLWHGTPLKKLGVHNNKGLKRKTSKIENLILNATKSLNPFKINPHMFISTSPDVSELFHEAYDIKNENFALTGYPRNDIFFDYSWIKNAIGENYLDKLSMKIDFTKVITYLPTFRSYDIDLFKNYGFDFDNIQKFLERVNAILIIKFHLYEENGTDFSEKYNRIHFVSDLEVPDIYPIMKNTDILITDYSSIFFDFMLTNRPIIFAPFDLDEYIQKERDLYFDYYSVTPGPKAYNWNEVMIQIVESIKNPSEYSKEREKANFMFNIHKNGEYSRRVYDEIMNRYY